LFVLVSIVDKNNPVTFYFVEKWSSD